MNKVQKIKEYLVGMAGTACCDAKTKKVIKANILPFIDSLQEEPVSVWHYQKNEPVNKITDKSRPIIVVYGNNSLNAADKFRCYEDNSDAIWLSNSYEKWAFVEDLINLTHLVNKTSDQEEPVSEDLEKAAKSYSNNIDNICGSIGEQTRNAFKAGARWADKHPRKDLVEINKIYIWLSDFLDKCYIEDRGEAEEINADLILKSFLKVTKGE